MDDDNGAGHGIAWVDELPENPLHRRLRDRPWFLSFRWAASCATATAVICLAFTLL